MPRERDAYYSQRSRHSQRVPSAVLSEDFWVAFRCALKRLAREGDFCAAFPLECQCGTVMTMNDTLVVAQMREAFGRASWPYGKGNTPSTDRMLDMVEFFFRHTARPSVVIECPECADGHPVESEGFDKAKARAEYATTVNGLFIRFHHPYRFRRGRVESANSAVLDGRMISDRFRSNDKHLMELLTSAVSDFFERSGSRKRIALCSLVDAFERVKTLEPGDKSQSVRSVIAKLSPTSQYVTR